MTGLAVPEANAHVPDKQEVLLRPLLSMRLRLPGLLILALAGNVFGADAPAPSEFAWRATLELPAGASMARVNLPAEALLRLQSSDARDVRVFNASGEPVVFAVSRPAAAAAAPAVVTQVYPAFGLFAGTAGTAPAAGSVQVHIDEPAGRRTVWVRLDGVSRAGDAPAIGMPVQAAIFTTRKEKQLLGAIAIQAELPANVPVQVAVATSPDLAEWTPVAVRGRLYRFEGAGAPANTTLEFEQPLRLEDRYLRLSWYGHDGVRVQSLTGTVAQATPPVPRVRAGLGAPVQTGKDTLNWSLAFATPLAALSLEAAVANTLVPIRILGRMDAAQPWRELAHTVVYRLGPAGQESVNPPVALDNALVRQLRMVAGNGLPLAAASLQASAEFDPLQVVFLASGAAPFTLVAGRANTAPAALGSATLASVWPGKLDDLPLARIADVVQVAAGNDGTWMGSFTNRFGGRNVVLWAALVAGVLLLAGVAIALLRQLKTAPGAGRDTKAL